jgi:hypothetical protein
MGLNMQEFLGVALEVVKANSIDEVAAIRDRFQAELDSYTEHQKVHVDRIKSMNNIVVFDYYAESLRKCIDFCNFNIAERMRKANMQKLPPIEEIETTFESKGEM